MAILGNLHAFVAVNGTRLQEYADKDVEMKKENPDVADKFIEAESGAEFTVEVEATKRAILTDYARGVIVYLTYKDAVRPS